MIVKEVNGANEAICESCGGFMMVSVSIVKKDKTSLYSGYLNPVWVCMDCQTSEVVRGKDSDFWMTTFNNFVMAAYGAIIAYLNSEGR